MKVNLGEYCAGLAASPERLKRFSSSMEEAREDMNSAGLTDRRLQDVLLSHDAEAIKRELDDQNASFSGGPGSGTSLLHAMTLAIPRK